MSIDFLSANLFAVGRAPNSVAIADVNGDGLLDIVVGGTRYIATLDPSSSIPDEQGISVLLGTGNGQFAPAVVSSGQDFGAAVDIALGDFNNDNRLDVITTGRGSNTTNNVFLALGDGTGTFTPKTPLLVSNSPVSVAVGDLDKDGNLDAVTANAGGNAASILWGDGTGGFQSSGIVLEGVPESVGLQDFDGDGRLDLAAIVFTSTAAKFIVLQGTATRAFTPSLSIELVPNQPTNFFSSTDFAFADFDRDGRLDVAALANNTISILLGTTTDEQFELAFQTKSASGNIATGDFNGDGYIDLATSTFDYATNTVSVLLGDGSGNFSRPAMFPTISSFVTTTTTAGDFNGDGKPDLVSATGGFASLVEVAVLINNTTRTDAITQGTQSFSKIGYIDASSEKSGSISVSLAQGKFVLNAPIRVTRSVQGIDDVIGTARTDEIGGNKNKNLLNGMGGNDELLGGRGDDRLIGGVGKDNLTGGEGKDRFIFSATPNYPEGLKISFRRELLGVDQILDFDNKTDKIVLDVSTFTKLNSRKKISFETVDDLASAKSSRGIIAYVQENGKLYYNPNGGRAGFGGGGLFAVLNNEAALSTQNFSTPV